MYVVVEELIPEMSEGEPETRCYIGQKKRRGIYFLVRFG